MTKQVLRKLKASIANVGTKMRRNSKVSKQDAKSVKKKTKNELFD